MTSLTNLELEELSQEWNKLGRALAADTKNKLKRFHEGKIDDPNLKSDSRSKSLADKVLNAIIELNQEGRWSEVRKWFDPAHAPFIPWMDNQGLPFVIALGHDEALFRRGSIYQDGHMWHVAGGELTPMPKLFAAGISTDRNMIALANENGIEVRLGWQGELITQFSWPTRDQLIPAWIPETAREQYKTDFSPNSLDYLVVSNSGKEVAIAVRDGVLVGVIQNEMVNWNLALPRHDEPDSWLLEKLEKGDSVDFHGDMVHVAISGDGNFLACGTQSEGHYLLKIAPDGTTSLWAKLGHHSEYPHNACFSSDGAKVAFNSCHFYSGATIVAEVDSVQGLTTKPYKEDVRTPVINSYLRVYASIWLPDGSMRERGGAFALAGLSILTIVTPDKEVRSELIFGSSASSIDYCPTSQTLIIGSYSGFLHFLKLSEEDPHTLGWRPPKELKRWCFFKDIPPIQW